MPRNLRAIETIGLAAVKKLEAIDLYPAPYWDARKAETLDTYQMLVHESNKMAHALQCSAHVLAHALERIMHLDCTHDGQCTEDTCAVVLAAEAHRQANKIFKGLMELTAKARPPETGIPNMGLPYPKSIEQIPKKD